MNVEYKFLGALKIKKSLKTHKVVYSKYKIQKNYISEVKNGYICIYNTLYVLIIQNGYYFK